MAGPLWLQGKTIKTASDGFEAEAGQPQGGRRKNAQSAADGLQGAVGRAALAAWRENEAYVHPDPGVEDITNALYEAWRQADPRPDMLRKFNTLDPHCPFTGCSNVRSQWYAVGKFVLSLLEKEQPSETAERKGGEKCNPL